MGPRRDYTDAWDLVTIFHQAIPLLIFGVVYKNPAQRHRSRVSSPGMELGILYIYILALGPNPDWVAVRDCKSSYINGYIGNNRFSS